MKALRPAPGMKDELGRMTNPASRTILVVALLASIPLDAPARAAGLPQRTTNLIVYGDDPCPRGGADEIVVCARRPDNERYRIPKALRDRRKEQHGGTSWASQWAGIDEQTRYTRPNSCSPVGSGGQTGCFNAMIRQWYAARRQMQDDAASGQ